MTLTINAALAVAFSWTSAGAGADLSVVFASGTSPVGVTLATGTYRPALAPTSGSVVELLRAVQSALNSAVSGAGRSEVFTVALNAAGKVVVSATGAFKIAWASFALGRILGFDTSMASAATSITATFQPWYLGYAVGAFGGRWESRRPLSGEETCSGDVYAFGAGAWTHSREWTLELVPRTPEDATAQECPGTPWWPSAQYINSLGETGTARAWSWVDLAAAATNAECAWTDEWTTVSASTTERFYVCKAGMPFLRAPQEDPIDETWPVYRRARLPLRLPSSSATSTRA